MQIVGYLMQRLLDHKFEGIGERHFRNEINGFFNLNEKHVEQTDLMY